jgi:hypothetical protein
MMILTAKDPFLSSMEQASLNSKTFGFEFSDLNHPAIRKDVFCRGRMSNWPSAKSKKVLKALLKIGWSIKREARGSHKILQRDG